MASFEIPDLLVGIPLFGLRSSASEQPTCVCLVQELDDAHAKASGAESVRDGVVSGEKIREQMLCQMLSSLWCISTRLSFLSLKAISLCR